MKLKKLIREGVILAAFIGGGLLLGQVLTRTGLHPVAALTGVKTYQVRADRLEGALEAAPFIGPGRSGPTLYLVTFRDCPPCIAYKRAEFPKLEAMGV